MLPNKTAKQIGEHVADRLALEMAITVGGPMDGQPAVVMGKRKSHYEQTKDGRLLMHRYELRREPGVRALYLYAGAVEAHPDK